MNNTTTTALLPVPTEERIRYDEGLLARGYIVCEEGQWRGNL